MISENNESCAEMGNSMNERIKVIVMSRLEAYQYCKKHHDKPSAKERHLLLYIPPREHHLHGVLAPRSRGFSATLYGAEHHPL